MTRLVKSLAKRLWGWTGAVRRPIARRLDGRLERILVAVVRDPIARHLHAIDATQAAQAEHLRSLGVSHHEMNIALNSCIREIARLELQVEELRLRLERVEVDEPDAFEPVGDPS